MASMVSMTRGCTDDEDEDDEKAPDIQKKTAITGTDTI